MVTIDEKLWLEIRIKQAKGSLPLNKLLIGGGLEFLINVFFFVYVKRYFFALQFRKFLVLVLVTDFSASYVVDRVCLFLFGEGKLIPSLRH